MRVVEKKTNEHLVPEFAQISGIYSDERSPARSWRWYSSFQQIKTGDSFQVMPVAAQILRTQIPWHDETGLGLLAKPKKTAKLLRTIPPQINRGFTGDAGAQMKRKQLGITQSRLAFSGIYFLGLSADGQSHTAINMFIPEKCESF